MATWVGRMVGAAKLSAATYEEVEADRGATWQAMAVVVLSSLAAGIGALNQPDHKGPVGLAFAALAGWVIWAFMTWFVGTKILPGPDTKSNPGELLRTLGFAQSPGILRVLGLVPGIGGLIGFVTMIWMLAAMVVAVRQALDYKSTGRAVAVCLIGFFIYVGILVGVALTFGLGAWLLGRAIVRT